MRNPMFFVPFLVVIFLVLFVLLILLFALIQIGAITIAFAKLGLTTNQVFLILLGTLFGSMVNIPIYRRPVSEMPEGTVIDLKGVWGHYRLPRYQTRTQTGQQIVSVNVGGCLIPCLLSIYFLTQIGLSLGLLLSFGLVSLATFKLARPVQGVGIGIPFLLPPLITVLAAWLLAPQEHIPQVAYIAGSLGTLVGADVLHLMNTRTMGRLQAPMLSIGGAGTFDGIFLSGILAVLLA